MPGFTITYATSFPIIATKDMLTVKTDDNEQTLISVFILFTVQLLGEKVGYTGEIPQRQTQMCTAL